MTETIGTERCEWSDLHVSECSHCHPGSRPPRPRTDDERALDQLRAEVKRAIEERATEVAYPLPIDRTTPAKVATSSTPRWNPGNVAAQIGSDLTAIEEMFAALEEEAENRYADSGMPGGDALVMLGPGADVEAFNYVQISALVGRLDEADVELPLKGDIEPPLSFLASWEDIIRDERDQPVWLNATIKRSVDYLRHSIDWMFSYDEYGDMRFIQVDDLADGLSRVRRRMEDILKDGARSEFTRVQCVADGCETKPRLMKLWAAQVRWDRYRCPACRQEYDKAQFELAKAQNLHSRGLERFIAPGDAADATGVPIKTVRSWMKRRKAERVWVTPPIGSPHAHVWWPDARDLAVERAARLKRQAARRAERKAELAAEQKRKEAEEEAA